MRFKKLFIISPFYRPFSQNAKHCPFPRSLSSDDDDECPFSPFSKREYLLAQIKQKNELIDSLIKQLHNPYLTTTLSIEAYTAMQHLQMINTGRL
ncbi:hypothetical protein F5148DRAFT_1283714 [Russula earlei]|uniref:Uncharacterized protein n=1 Tax=Russula earlei TaxID=71964 RepID=A0ACC0UAP8_9AGAM|nr:hypothetical protein F5148DRAFT_1283714 [Russula earlei]